MPDAKLSDLPAATALNDNDLAPVVQGSGVTAETRRASMAQLRAAMQAERDLHVRDFGAVGNGTTDDVVAIQAAINAASAAGGGIVLLGARRYLIAAADLDVRPGVTLMGGASGGQREAANYGSVPFALILSAARTVRLRRGSRLEGLAILRSGLTTPTTMREALNAVAAFAGTAVTIGDGTGAGGGNGADARIERLLILGFDRAIVSDFNARVQIRDVLGDNRNGIVLARAYDIARMHGVHFWPFVTGNLTAISLVSNVITAVANNGSGLVRITTGTAHGLLTGDLVNITAVGGVAAANGRFTVTLINANVVDLQASAFSGAYTTGGLLHVWNNRRTGTAFRLTDSDVCEFVDCFAYGYDIGFDLGTGSQATQIVNSSVDNNTSVADPATIGLRIGGNAFRTKWIGGFISSMGTTVRVESTSNDQHHMVGAVVNGGAVRTVDMVSGALTIEASDLTSGPSLFGTGNPCVVNIQDAAANLTLIGNDLKTATFTAQSDAALQKIIVIGNRLNGTQAARVGGGSVEFLTIPSAASGLTRRMDIAADGTATLRRRSASLGARLNLANSADQATNFISIGTGNSLAIGGDPTLNPNGGLDLGSPSGATAPFTMQLRRVSATPIAGDRLAQVQFNGLNTAAAEVIFARLSAFADTVTAGSEAGSISLETRQGAALTERFRLSATGTLTLGGPLVLAADPTAALQAATKQYVDARAGVATVAGRSGAVTLAVADVAGAAPLASAALTGTPTAPTATPGTVTMQVATTAFVAASSFTTHTDFVASGTFTRIPSAKSYTIRAGGAGGGAGGGARGAPGTATSGGAGGGGGAVVQHTIMGSEITADLTIIIGAAGVGGAGATGANTAGTAGTAGAASTITMGGVPILTAYAGGGGAGGQLSAASGGGGGAGLGGNGGSTATATAGTAGVLGGVPGGVSSNATHAAGCGGFTGTNGAAGNNGGLVDIGGCGGASGGGTSTTSTAFGGGGGRIAARAASTLISGGANTGGAGAVGSDAAPGMGGYSGGGGGGNIGGAGGAGGSAGRSAGGGGGGSAEGGSGGRGGDGGTGWVQVIVNY